MKTSQIVKWLFLLAVLLTIISLWWQGQRPQAVTTPVGQIKCQPQQGNCIAKIGEGELQWFVEQPIQYLQPFISKVKLKNISAGEVQRISVEFAMQGMEMALNRSVFKRQSPTSWQAQSILPICASGRKDWLAIVRVETRQKVWLAGFQFMLPAKSD